MLSKDNLDETLRKWREKRGRNVGSKQQPTTDRRTVRVNGQEVVVVTKTKRALA